MAAPAPKSRPASKPTSPATPESYTVMGKYAMLLCDEDIMGEGTSSLCRKGTTIATGAAVAIKTYKSNSKHDEDEINARKFVRQIAVLKELMEPLRPPPDPTLWDSKFSSVRPSSIFMQLLDYSQTSSGEPATDADGVRYVVTELASYSLKDYLNLRHEQRKPLSPASVLDMTKAILTVMAGLHTKQLVHLDMKPENLMVFSGCLKLIDVDGCVRIGTKVKITDASLSFSPCYCAPEWASFLIEDSDDPTIVITPGLDVWSVGMTICEVVALDAVLKPTYASFMRHGRSQREAGFLFMDWLSGLRKAPISKKVQQADPMLVELLADHLLVPDPLERKSCAQCLQHPYVCRKPAKPAAAAASGATYAAEAPPDASVEEGAEASTTHACKDMPEDAPREMKRGKRREDTSNNLLHQGTLWKLNAGGDPQELKDWLKRDMWIAANGSLCYFSHKENKRLVLVDAQRLSQAEIQQFARGAKEHAFELKSFCDLTDAGAEESAIFACESQAEYTTWIHFLSSVKKGMMDSFRLGSNLARDLRQFRLHVKNRRMKVPESDAGSDHFAPVFRGKLAKVKSDGDRAKPGDWFEREFWLSKNGSLVYFSPKEERDLVYYTSGDIAHATIKPVPNDSSARPWTFSVNLPAVGGVAFSPGEFAAETEALRDTWIDQLRSFAGLTG